MNRIIVGIGSGVATLISLGLLPPRAVAAPLPGVALAAAVSCAQTPIQSRPFLGPLRGLRWIMATPTSRGITGHLFYGRAAHGLAADLHIHGTMPDGGTTKILWVITHGHIGSQLLIDGHNLTTRGQTHQEFPAVGGGGVPGTQFPSIIDVPTPGCWQFQLRSGDVTGTVTLRAVS